MNAGESTFRSLLEKPLHELTEEDFEQVTREDCRTYLKQKGMRRPSWNKSQAIQQVISLKNLLETTGRPGGGAPPNVSAPVPEIPPQVTSNSADWVKEGSASEVEISVSANRSGELVEHTVDTGDKALFPRTENMSNWSVGQMTIFYCGKVNVYERMPIKKARAIMHLAASPTLCLQDDPSCRTAACWSSPFPLQTASVELTPILYEAKISPGMQRETEAQMNRRVLLQRYLEKRKDSQDADFECATKPEQHRLSISTWTGPDNLQLS